MDGSDQSNPGQGQNPPAGSGNGGAPPADGGAPPAAAARPDWAPEKFWDAEKGQLRVEDLAKGHRELEQKLGKGREAWEAERLAKRPKDANGYALSASKNAPRDLVILDKPPGADFQREEGKRYFVADPNDPLVQLARKHAHAAGMDQDQFSTLFTDFAELRFADQARTDKMIEEGRAQTMKALGENAQARIDQVSRMVEKFAGADAVTALDIGYLPAPAIEALEKILEGAGGGTAAFQSSGSRDEVASLTDAEVRALMASPNYWKAGSDEHRKVTEFFKRNPQKKLSAA